MNEGGLAFEVVSQDIYIMDEVTYQPNVIERKVYDVSIEEFADDFDGIMIVSGNMADTEAYWDDKHVLALIAKAHEQDKPIAAICCSVPTIRNVAEGKKVSFFPLVRSRDRLRRAGAILQTVAFTVDDKLVTAEHQMASQMWALAFVEIMFGREVKETLTDSGFMPKGHERKPVPALERLKDVNAKKEGQ
jgi:putative intracellular protease/amidase